MKNLARFFGGLGIIFLVFGLIATLMFEGQLRAVGYAQLLLGVIGLSIFLFYFFGEFFKALTRKREVIFGIIGAFVILLILIGANIVAHSKWGERKYDTTINKIHSLSPDTVTLVKNLTAPITIVGFFSEGSREKDLVKDLAEKYTYLSNQITFNVYDPDHEPALLKQFDAQNDQVLVRNEKTKKTIKLTAISEQDLTTSLKRVLSTNQKTIYFLQGHGEGDLDDDKTGQGLLIQKVLLENEGFKVVPLNLVAQREIPKDASIIAAWGAQRPYTKAEVDLLSTYLEKGGALIIAQDPLLSTSKDKLIATGLEPLLEKYGLQFKPSVVLEYQIQLLRGKVINAKLAAAEYGEHPITSRLGKQNVTEFFLVQPVLQTENFKSKDITRIALALTSQNTWAETDMNALFITQKPSSDGKKSGPLPIGQIAEWPITATKDTPASQSRLIVYGDADFGTNQLIQSGFNRDLVLNTYGFVAGEEATVSIRPKSWTTSTLEIDLPQRRLIYYASVFVVPQLIMALGVVIWLVRRGRSMRTT
ncbi:MAG: GldG family protein [Deltaproteobacteria bacterium]|nr:GldG family protein [Deltaproteobacteria bacterium]